MSESHKLTNNQHEILRFIKVSLAFSIIISKMQLLKAFQESEQIDKLLKSQMATQNQMLLDAMG